MATYIIYHDVNGEVSEPVKCDREYIIGDVITVNTYDNKYKCIELIEENGDVFHLFKQGKTIYTYDY